MKYILMSITIILVLSACSSKNSGVSDKEYYRANTASEKSLDKLDRE